MCILKKINPALVVSMNIFGVFRLMLIGLSLNMVVNILNQKRQRREYEQLQDLWAGRNMENENDL